MKILWFFDKQMDISTSKSARIEIIKYLQNSHQVILVTGYRNEKLQFRELQNEIIYIDSLNLPFVNRYDFYRTQTKHFLQLVQDFQPDILLFNTMNLKLMKQSMYYQNEYKYKVFLDIRTLPVSSNRFRNTLDYYLFAKTIQYAAMNFTGISYITPGMANYCKSRFRLPEHSSAIWSSGVNLEKFVPMDLNESNNTFSILYHGTIARNRGLGEFIRAIKRLPKFDITVNFIGGGDGEGDLKNLVSNLGLEQQVKFHGFMPFDKIPEQINLSTIGVLPFPDYDGWNTSSPIKLFEYLACGKPVIVTKIPAHTDVLEGKEFAFWAQNSSPEKLGDAVISAYNAKSKFRILGKNARDFVSKAYSWEQQAQKLEAFITNN